MLTFSISADDSVCRVCRLRGREADTECGRHSQGDEKAVFLLHQKQFLCQSTTTACNFGHGHLFQLKHKVCHTSLLPSVHFI